MDQLPGTHSRKGYVRRDGTRVRSTTVRNRGRRSTAASPAHPTYLSSSPARPRKSKKGLVISVAITATIAGGVVVSLSRAGASRGNLSVQVSADLTHTIAVFSKLGFHNASNINTGNPGFGTDCAASATGQVRQFLSRHPCKEYAIARLKTERQGINGLVVLSWVVMPNASLASQYKSMVDRLGTGNPPGQSSAFTGGCYASGENGDTVWAEQVQPTGHVAVDRDILQAAAPVELAKGYLQVHCKG